MSGIQIADAKAPFIMFERRAVEDRAASIEQGRYVARDVDIVLITPHGSKDQFERVADDWISNMEAQVQQGRLDQNWLRAYKQAYANWKEGRETPLEGTSIANWPVVSPAQVELLRSLRVLTVEVLANANEELIKRLGMGGRTLVDKARDYLAVAQDKGKVVEEVGNLRGKVEGLQKTVEQLAATNEQLMAELRTYRAGVPGAQPAAQPASSGPGIGASDLIDDEPPAQPKRKL